jgi:hypothetical protein
MPISTISSAGLATGGIGRSNMYTGAVLQVVQASTSTETTIATTTYTDTSLTGTITPSSSTSKILVMISQQARVVSGSNPSGSGFKLKLLRGSTGIADFGASGSNAVELTADNGGNVRIASYTSVTYLDSPSTTSSTTYKTQASVNSGTANVSFQGGNTGVSFITLMEIAA